jgi:hypothetical protein
METHQHSPKPSGNTSDIGVNSYLPFDKSKLRGTAQPGRVGPDPQNVPAIQGAVGRGGSSQSPGNN